MAKDNKSGFVNIHGKNYETVASRVQRFRESHPTLRLTSEIIQLDNEICIIRSTIYNEKGEPVANGHAQEWREASNINATSYVENCETSAIGRALACFGIGGENFASADEVTRAINIQNELKSEALKKKLSKPNTEGIELPMPTFETSSPDRQAEAQKHYGLIMGFASKLEWEAAAFHFYGLGDSDLQLIIWDLLKPLPAVRRNIKSRAPAFTVPETLQEAYEPGSKG